MNKKIIFVILLFIGISFIVYSFASPVTESDNDLSQNQGTQNENNNNYNDHDDDSDINNNDIVENPEDDDDNDDAEDKTDQENNNSSNQNEQIVVTNPPVSETKYYCRFVNNKYYGSTGVVVSYKTYLNQCVSKPEPTPTPDPIYTCKYLNGQYYGKNGNIVTQNTYVSECVPPQTYICQYVDGIYYGKNGYNVSSSVYTNECLTKPDEPKGPSTLFASSVELDKDPSFVVPLVVSSNTKDEATSTNFMTLTGVMQQKNTLVDDITTGYYVTLKLYVPKEFTTKESLNDLTVKTKSKVLTQAKNNIVKEDSNGYYIVWNQAFRTGGVYSITINWNKDTVATYKITCNIETF